MGQKPVPSSLRAGHSQKSDFEKSVNCIKVKRIRVETDSLLHKQLLVFR